MQGSAVKASPHNKLTGSVGGLLHILTKHWTEKERGIFSGGHFLGQIPRARLAIKTGEHSEKES